MSCNAAVFSVPGNCINICRACIRSWRRTTSIPGCKFPFCFGRKAVAVGKKVTYNALPYRAGCFKAAKVCGCSNAVARSKTVELAEHVAVKDGFAPVYAFNRSVFSLKLGRIFSHYIRILKLCYRNFGHIKANQCNKAVHGSAAHYKLSARNKNHFWTLAKLNTRL